MGSPKGHDLRLRYARNGIILCTEQYEACVDFYSNILELPILFILDNEHSKLTCLEMDGSYLMIETSGTAVPTGKDIDQNPVCIRFNVEDVEAVADELGNRGAQVTIRKEVWGTVGDFVDPDGNRCSLRDESSFFPDSMRTIGSGKATT